MVSIPVDELLAADFLAQGARWSGVAKLIGSGDTSDHFGTAVLIGSRVALTVAHNIPGGSGKIYFQDGSAVDVTAFPHPDLDLALLKLASDAPAGAKKYAVSTESAIGKQITILGYGTPGTGNQGYDPNPASPTDLANRPLQIGYNRYDYAFGGDVLYDFDNGLDEQNAMERIGLESDLGIVIDGALKEVMVTPSDSGGPSFIAGDLLVGIHRSIVRAEDAVRSAPSGIDIDDQRNASFGELGLDIPITDDVWTWVTDKAKEIGVVISHPEPKVEVEVGSAGTIPGIYLALFGRPADPLGLAFFNAATGNGADLTAIGDLAGTAEYQDRFTGFTPAEIVIEIYQSLFNRSPDVAGLQYFVGELVSGRQTINSIAINILDGARNADRIVIENKLVAAMAFTAALDTADEIAAYQGNLAAAAGRALLSGITADPATIPDAEAIAEAIAEMMRGQTTDPDIGGQLFLLTTGIDDLVGTAGDDRFIADPDAGTQTLNSGDVIIGGGGNDTLEGELPDGGVTDPVLRELSAAFLKFTGGGTFSAGNSSFNGTLWSDASTTGATFTNVTPQLSVGVRGTGATSLSTVTASFISDRGTFRLDNANGETLVTPSPLDTLNVLHTGKNAISLEANQTKSLLIDGATLHLTIRSADSLESITVHSITYFELSPFLVKEKQFSFSGGANDSKVVLIADAADQTFTVRTSIGNDEVRTGIAADVINLGAGADFVAPGSGADRIFLGLDLSTDRVFFRPGDSDDSPENLTIVQGFVSGDDKIDVGSFGASLMVEGQRAQLQGDIASLGVDATLRQALDIAEEYAPQDVLTHFVFKGNTYVYIDQTNPNAGYAEGDFVVQLSGALDLVRGDFEL